MGEPEPSEEDVMKVLIATDCHLGYAERDAVRGNDSFVTFEEILSTANAENVDMILLGGDLFHDNKPSRKTLHTCIQLLRKYCMGDKPIQIEFLSDQSENFKFNSFPCVNYEDPNLNISIPVFSIHGNHDDPAGQGNLSSLDLLSVSGLINYFGKCTDLDNVKMSPLLMQKGKTKLALYGLGSIRDERLHRMFREGKVSMLRPREDSETWFNLFVVHQNRSRHGLTNYLPEQFLDDFLDLVIWGHEHECRIKPEWNAQQNFYVCQPGSSVATSLCPGEAVPKCIGVLQIYKRNFKLSKIPLQTVRQFYIEDVVLSETSLNPEDPDIAERVVDYCCERVENLIDKAVSHHTGNRKQPNKPIIRLRIEYTDKYETFSVNRFGQKYVDRVANPKDIIHFHRKRGESVKPLKVDVDMEQLQKVLKQEGLDQSRVEDLVKEYFEAADDNRRLFLLSETGMGAAVKEFVDKDVPEALQDLINHQVEKVQNFLKQRDIDDKTIDDEIDRYKEERKKTTQEVQEVEAALEKTRQRATEIIPNSDSEMNLDDEITESSGLGRFRALGKGRGAQSRRGSRSKTESKDASSKRGRGQGRGRGSTKNGTKVPVRNTLKQAFENQLKKEKCSFYDSPVEISSGDEYDLSPKKTKTQPQAQIEWSHRKTVSRNTTTGSQRKQRRKGTVYNSSDSDDDDNRNPFD